jgi:hypothetical protein
LSRRKIKTRFVVKEAGDEPRTGYAVNVDVGTGDPLHVNSFFGNSPYVERPEGFLEKSCLVAQTFGTVDNISTEKIYDEG